MARVVKPLALMARGRQTGAARETDVPGRRFLGQSDDSCRASRGRQSLPDGPRLTARCRVGRAGGGEMGRLGDQFGLASADGWFGGFCLAKGGFALSPVDANPFAVLVPK